MDVDPSHIDATVDDMDVDPPVQIEEQEDVEMVDVENGIPMDIDT
jgi:hypothetical protein